jgi:hypothetical protein
MLAWLLYFTKLTIEVDGIPSIGSWGRRELALDPGDHEVRVFFRYLWRPRCGEAAVRVQLSPEEKQAVSYRAPWLMTGAGKLQLVS